MLEERTLVALYKTMKAAERTRARLIEIGLPGEQVSISGEGRAGSTADYEPQEKGGFLQALKELFLPDDDLYHYSEGVRRGAKMVTAHVPGQMIEQAAAVMEEADPLDVETSLQEWRSAGWSDYGRVRSDDDQRRVKQREADRPGRVRSYRF